MNAAVVSPAASSSSSTSTSSASPAHMALQATNIKKQFGENVVIADLSIGFETGLLHSILGPNGAGKTTLFNLLARDYPVSAGEIFLRGERITGLKPEQIAQRGVGRSYQISSVYQDLTFAQNVWLGAHAHGKRGRAGFWKSAQAHREFEDQAADWLEKLGLIRYRHTLASAVSYGDQRLLELAVTLATQPTILLLDEPTAGLSQRETNRVKDFIQSIKSQYTIVMIEHKMNVVMEISDKVHVMAAGALIASGTAEEISRNEMVHSAYFGL